MHILHRLSPLFATAALAACAASGSGSSTGTTGAAPAPSPAAAPAPAAAPSPYGPTRIVKSRDGRFDGEMVGTPRPGGKFARLAIGMTMDQVTSAIGGPDNMSRNETGKRWIPFYFGNDAQRMQVLYKGEGCLTYTGGNVFGGGGMELIRITATSRTDCME